MRINIYTNTQKSQFRNVKDGVWQILGIPITVDDAVMNGILYPKDENLKGLNSYRGKPVVLTHPTDENGNGISVTSGRAMMDNFCGGIIINTYNANGINYADAEFKESMLRAQDNGEYYANRLKNGEPIGISTGLYFDGNNDSGTINGEEYQSTAINQVGDHVAMLPDDEPPAGGAATFIRFNGENNEQEITVNIDGIISNSNTVGVMGADHRNNESKLLKIIKKITGTNKEEIGYQLLAEKLVMLLRDGSSDEESYYWIDEVYSDYFVYVDSGDKLLKQTYTIDGDNVSFTGSPVEVSKDVKYKDPITNKEGDAMRGALEKKLTAKGIAFNAQDTDAELLDKLTVQPEPVDIAAAINKAIAPLTEQITELKTELANNADKEIEALAKQAAPLMGLEEAEAKALGANALHKVLAKNGVVVGAPLATNSQSPTDNEAELIVSKPWEA